MESKMNCIFCEDKFRSRIFAQLNTVFCVYDSYSVTDFHTLIIPYRHCDSLFDMTDQEIEDTMTILRCVKDMLLNRDTTITGFNIFWNCGMSAGQTIAHAHCHVIPRRGGDVENPKGGCRNVIPGKGDYTLW